MSKFKNARAVNYLVQRERSTGNYFVINLAYSKSDIIKKTTNGWYAQGIYHKTLRDAIIYTVYGV